MKSDYGFLHVGNGDCANSSSSQCWYGMPSQILWNVLLGSSRIHLLTNNPQLLKLPNETLGAEGERKLVLASSGEASCRHHCDWDVGPELCRVAEVARAHGVQHSDSLRMLVLPACCRGFFRFHMAEDCLSFQALLTKQLRGSTRVFHEWLGIHGTSFMQDSSRCLSEGCWGYLPLRHCDDAADSSSGPWQAGKNLREGMSRGEKPSRSPNV